eukprot:scaffold37489_cov68-Phaeocystis_antarctica.AAC.5
MPPTLSRAYSVCDQRKMVETGGLCRRSRTSSTRRFRARRSSLPTSAWRGEFGLGGFDSLSSERGEHQVGKVAQQEGDDQAVRRLALLCEGHGRTKVAASAPRVAGHELAEAQFGGLEQLRLHLDLSTAPLHQVPHARCARPLTHRQATEPLLQLQWLLTAPRLLLAGHGRGCGRGSGCSGLGSLALRLQRRQRLADLPGARFQVWLLLPQLGEQRFEAEVGIGHSQPAQRCYALPEEIVRHTCVDLCLTYRTHFSPQHDEGHLPHPCPDPWRRWPRRLLAPYWRAAVGPRPGPRARGPVPVGPGPSVGRRAASTAPAAGLEALAPPKLLPRVSARRVGGSAPAGAVAVCAAVGAAAVLDRRAARQLPRLAPGTVLGVGRAARQARVTVHAGAAQRAECCREASVAPRRTPRREGGQAAERRGEQHVLGDARVVDVPQHVPSMMVGRPLHAA